MINKKAATSRNLFALFFVLAVVSLIVFEYIDQSTSMSSEDPIGLVFALLFFVGLVLSPIFLIRWIQARGRKNRLIEHRAMMELNINQAAQMQAQAQMQAMQQIAIKQKKLAIKCKFCRAKFVDPTQSTCNSCGAPRM